MTPYVLLAIGLAGVLSVFGILFAINYLRERDTRSAASRTTQGAGSITSGVIVSGLVLATDLIGSIIGLVFSAPEAFTTGVLGVVGYLSIDGIISVTPETWALMVIVAFVLATLGRDFYSEVSSR